MLLNAPPDTTGQIPKEYIDRLQELKRAIDAMKKGKVSGTVSMPCERLRSVRSRSRLAVCEHTLKTGEPKSVAL